VPLKENVGDYITREVLPYAPDAWVDEAKTQIGYEISARFRKAKKMDIGPLQIMQRIIIRC
jgi:hypothetical protein